MNSISDEQLAALQGHTPGPWKLGTENNAAAEVEIGNTETVASLCRESSYTGKMTHSREEMLANTHLIMAAPDLLADLIAARARVKDQAEVERILSDSLAACGKAAGAPKNCDPQQIYEAIKALRERVKELEVQAYSPSGALEMIAAERQRQITIEGWTPEHDDHEHSMGELSEAACCYATVASAAVRGSSAEEWPVEMFNGHNDSILTWPWDDAWWKPSDDPVRNLVKAAALIVAEIERIQRKEAQ